MSNFRKFLNHLSDLLFPGICPICEKAPYKDGLSYMCVECEDLLPWIQKNGCKYCGIPMSGFDFNGMVCAGCREDPPTFQAGKCLFLLDQNGSAANSPAILPLKRYNYSLNNTLLYINN